MSPPAHAAPSSAAAPPEPAGAAFRLTREDRIRAAELEARARVLSTRLRCIECGHQSIEDSNADAAVFMRRMIRQQLREGQREPAILDALKLQFGDSVVYSPPFQGATAALWLTPVALLGTAAVVSVWRRRSSRPTSAAAAASLAAARRASQLPVHSMGTRRVRGHGPKVPRGPPNP